nr:hypothetical protein [Micromonospora purpureochromogenes]
MTTTTAPADPTVGGRHGWRVVAALAVTSTIGYGTLYYAYAVLLGPMAAGLGASTTAVTGALTAPVTTAKAAAPLLAAVLLAYGGYHLLLAAVTSSCLLAATAMRSVGSGSPR